MLVALGNIDFSYKYVIFIVIIELDQDISRHSDLTLNIMSTSTLLYSFLDMIKAIPYANRYYIYLGGTDVQKEGTFVWTDGSPGINKY